MPESEAVGRWDPEIISPDHDPYVRMIARPDGDWVMYADHAAALSAATRRADAMREALAGLLPYRAHLRSCEVFRTEFCTCGMKQFADAARKALGEA